MRRLGWALVVIGAAGASASACKGPMAKIEGMRDALASDDAGAIASSVEGLPACPEMPPVALAPGDPSPRDGACLTEIANALGSKKGFSPKPPDQAAAATAAAVITRDGRGDYLAHSDVWLGSIKSGKGPGPEALRLAVARRMAEAAPAIGRRIEEEGDARAAMKAVATAVPGACPTYWLVGTSAPNIAPELSADHAACVHRDLGRREGVGSSYGSGVFRALEGSLALWREAERALRMGAGASSPPVKAAIEAKLAVIEDATRKNETKKIDATVSREVLEFLGEVHADAGVALWKSKDAGADGGDGGADGDAGAPAGPVPPRLKRR